MCAGCSDGDVDSRAAQKKEKMQRDSIDIGIRVFESVEKEFVSRWHYKGDRNLLMRSVEKVCEGPRQCASKADSVAYGADVRFILDSLMRDGLLKESVEGQRREEPGEIEHKKNVKRILDSLLKERKVANK